MPGGPHAFKRIVLGLQSRAPDRPMRLAVELADLLRLDLLGLFLEDPGLQNLAGIPFAREFRSLGAGWHPLDHDRLSRDLELAARTAARMFADAASRLTTRCRFEVIRGGTAETIASISQTDDIVMVAEPVSPAERATQQFAGLIEAAFRSTAAVMLVPTRIARTAGPVVAIAATPDDPSIQAAAAFALAANEELVIVGTDESTAHELRICQLATETGLTIKHILPGGIPLSDPTTLRHLRERLVVVTRGMLADEATMALASARRIPVLVIEPPDTPGEQSRVGN